MFRKKRGQAALEFLTTYGWAFLVILVMIAALAYFGVLSPENFQPEKCLFGLPFSGCQDKGAVVFAGDQVISAATGSTTEGMHLNLINGGGKGITITRITATVTGVTSVGATGGNNGFYDSDLAVGSDYALYLGSNYGSLVTTNAADYSLVAGGAIVLHVPVNIEPGDKPGALFTITYTEDGSVFEKTTEGTVALKT